MFANRFTVFLDACTLAGALKRNLLLSLAEAEFFRLRWSGEVLSEAERAIEQILRDKGVPDATDRAQRARHAMEDAFEDALVTNYEGFLPVAAGLPDPDDAHVLAAALKTNASMIVTENLKDFPPHVLSALNIEAKCADHFVADTVLLDEARAVAAIRKMRERFKRPEKTAEALLLDMDAAGLVETVNVLKPYVASL